MKWKSWGDDQSGRIRHAKAAYQVAALRQARIDRGDEVIVGVNKYQPQGKNRT